MSAEVAELGRGRGDRGRTKPCLHQQCVVKGERANGEGEGSVRALNMYAGCSQE